MSADQMIERTGIVRLTRAAANPIAIAPDSSTLTEQAVLGAILLDGAALERLKLGVVHFATEEHRYIFQVMLDCREAGDAIDFVSVSQRLTDAGRADLVAYVALLAENSAGSANIERYAAVVLERAQRRDLAALGADLVERANSPAVDISDLRREIGTRLQAIGAGREAWPALNIAKLAEREPQRPRHIVPDWFPAGEVTLLAGHGGAGKSGVALYLGACIALGASWCGIATERRRVVYVSAEDGADVLHWRLARICAHLQVALADLAGHLELLDVSHQDAELMLEPGRGDEPILTARYDSLRERLTDATVLILDGASDLYGGNEIVRRHVRRYVRALRRLIGPEGAVLLLAHVDKAAARNGAESDRYSGSTAWHNSVRARWSLAADGEALALTLAKANHAKAGAEIRMRWDAEARLYVADQAPTEGGIVGAIRERQEREGVLVAMRACAAAGVIVPAALQGPRTAYNVLSARPELPDSLRSGPQAGRRFRARLEELRQIHAVIEREIRRSNRHSTLALVLADRGNAPHAPHSQN
ncbi:MAG: hypothetical protein A3G81_22515 [Betaproteobacteria bacterium RIFCSPLOWO2_12_FULL_65_14]|nr:MAG: hypothetical protein A3G81_22515 [Betaproteobacteria bacterium RIFCSPLOWO2_12_FULL_65_14]